MIAAEREHGGEDGRWIEAAARHSEQRAGVDAVKMLVQLGADTEAKDVGGATVCLMHCVSE
jgi:hypothetical protein